MYGWAMHVSNLTWWKSIIYFQRNLEYLSHVCLPRQLWIFEL